MGGGCVPGRPRSSWSAGSSPTSPDVADTATPDAGAFTPVPIRRNPVPGRFRGRPAGGGIARKLDMRARSSDQEPAPGAPGVAGRLRWVSLAAAGWALAYALYRAYYAVGGAAGMFGVPVSESQWRFVNGAGA